MKRITISLVAAIAALVVLLPAPALADGNGNVTVHLNGTDDVFYLCEWNFVGIYLTNDAPLYGLSLGFSFTDPFDNLVFDPSWGDIPADSTSKYLRLHGPAIGAFDLTGYQVEESLPDSIRFYGEASTNPLPASAIPTLCFSLKVQMPGGVEMYNGFCVTPISYGPNGTWEFVDSSPYAPDFQGVSTGSTTNPSAPSACFDVIVRPVIDPDFTSVPEPSVENSHCQDFVFDIDAADFNIPPATLTYFTDAGAIDSETGLLTVPPPIDCGSTDVTVTAHGAGCSGVDYNFTINWTNQPPTLSGCSGDTIFILAGIPREFDFSPIDPDQCDNLTVGFFSPDSAAISSTYEVVQSGTSKLRVTASSADSCFGPIQFIQTAEDQCGAADSCAFWLQVVPFIAGDADYSGGVSVGDAVYLVNFIFGGGPEPTFYLAGDADCSGSVTIGDAVYIINYIFGGGPPPFQCYIPACN